MTLGGALLLDADGELQRGWISVDGAIITGVGFDDSVAIDVKLDGRTILPGFVDMHCHGGGGASYASADPEQIARAAHTHRAHGTTTTNASLVSATYEDLARQIRALIPLSTMAPSTASISRDRGSRRTTSARTTRPPCVIRTPTRSHACSTSALAG